MKNVLGIEEAGNNEFQRVHRTGKSRNEGGSRIIIARFLRFTDRDHVFKCGHKLKGTDFKMYEDIPN